MRKKVDGAHAAGNAARAKEARRHVDSVRRASPPPSRATVEAALERLTHEMELVGIADAQIRDASVIVRAAALAVLHGDAEAFRGSQKGEMRIMKEARDLSRTLGKFVDRERELVVLLNDDEEKQKPTAHKSYASLGDRIASYIRSGLDARTTAARAVADLIHAPSLGMVRDACPRDELTALTSEGLVVLGDRFDLMFRSGGMRALEAVHRARAGGGMPDADRYEIEAVARALADEVLSKAGISRSQIANWRRGLPERS